MRNKLTPQGRILIQKKKELKDLLGDVPGIDIARVYMFPKKGNGSTRLGVSFAQNDPEGFLPEYLYMLFDSYSPFRNADAKWTEKEGVQNITALAKPHVEHSWNPFDLLSEWHGWTYKAVRHYIIETR